MREDRRKHPTHIDGIEMILLATVLTADFDQVTLRENFVEFGPPQTDEHVLHTGTTAGATEAGGQRLKSLQFFLPEQAT